ncbi:hypothetical protein [Limnobacter parvus]|uniref:Lipoprotein n=1 Tax=Limnobacter parvus TaxID=2939690 RepID=A0ABT1XH29_9BURK|nr:hypothetical protein [Limnobacter parvus]MCR2746577.1 hypothetical protein [Limnobacter parvus]
MFSSRVVIAASMALLAACSTVPSNDSPRWEQVGLDILKQGCAGASVVYTDVPNRHVVGLIDQLKTVRCDGFVSQTYHSKAASNPQGLPISLQLSKPHPGLPGFLDLGTDIRSVEQHLGPSKARKGNSLLYEPSEGNNALVIHVDQEKVVSLRWDWNVD